ncbi:hypothetical protein [Catenulispora rubra]|uniref:hypothetical protein n=1 Tax=Catenulispora rubra TaxID=280293 RepID=UPI001892632A|nr:hypothetical protein [Catenulispora rubra]
MTRLRRTAVGRADFKDWAAYRVQVDTERAPRQVAEFSYDPEAQGLAGVWIYGTTPRRASDEWPTGIRIGAVATSTTCSGQFRYTAISDVHYSPAGTSSADPTVTGFGSRREAVCLLYGRWLERRARFLAPADTEPADLPDSGSSPGKSHAQTGPTP